MVVVPFLKLNLCIVHNSWRIPDQDILPFVTQLKLACEWNHGCWSLAQRKTSARHESCKSSQDRLAVSPRHMIVLNWVGCLNLLKFLKNIRQACHSSHSVIWEPWSAERANYRETKKNSVTVFNKIQLHSNLNAQNRRSFPTYKACFMHKRSFTHNFVFSAWGCL